MMQEEVAIGIGQSSIIYRKEKVGCPVIIPLNYLATLWRSELILTCLETGNYQRFPWTPDNTDYVNQNHITGYLEKVYGEACKWNAIDIAFQSDGETFFQPKNISYWEAYIHLRADYDNARIREAITGGVIQEYRYYRHRIDVWNCAVEYVHQPIDVAMLAVPLADFIGVPLYEHPTCIFREGA